MTRRWQTSAFFFGQLGDDARSAYRRLLSGVFLLIVITGSLLAYGLSKTAESTARQIGQREANLLAEGEAERLHLTFDEGIWRVTRDEIETALAAIGHDRPEIQSMKLIDADGRVIGVYARSGTSQSEQERARWHTAVGRLEASAGHHSQLLLSLHRKDETRLTSGRILTVFSVFTAVWALLAHLVLRGFCRAYIEAPARQLRELRVAAYSDAPAQARSGGLWQEAIQEEIAKQEKLAKLMRSLRWRAEALRRQLPSHEAEALAALRTLDDLARHTAREYP